MKDKNMGNSFKFYSCSKFLSEIDANHKKDYYVFYCLVSYVQKQIAAKKQIYSFSFRLPNALIYIQDANDLAVQQYLNSNYTPQEENSFVDVF